MIVNDCIRYVRPPDGQVGADCFRRQYEPLPALREGELLVRNEFLSLDPSQRRQMMPGVQYTEMLNVGDVMIGRTMGRVLESRSQGFLVGDWVRGKLGWQTHAVSDGAFLERIDLAGIPPSVYLGILGNPGITAWVGLNVIAQARAGETVVVSAACGAVGSVAVAIAKDAGCNVVGIAGGPDKCRFAVEELGYDACVDYRSPSFVKSLEQATPRGVDVDFENVGGIVMDAVVERLNLHARVALCGLISQYNASAPASLANIGTVLNMNATIKGFRLANYAQHRAEAASDIAALYRRGSLQARETMLDGLGSAPDAFLGLFEGANVGKMLVRLGEMGDA